MIGREVGQPMANKRLGIDDARLAAFCAKHHITRLALFGSVLAGRDQRLSDVDLLVEFEPGRAPGLLALSGMEAELSVLLDGRKVDLRTPRDLSRYFRDAVIREGRGAVCAMTIVCASGTWSMPRTR
jgi:predicted nucleotidyltransferase